VDEKTIGLRILTLCHRSFPVICHEAYRTDDKRVVNFLKWRKRVFLVTERWWNDKVAKSLAIGLFGQRDIVSFGFPATGKTMRIFSNVSGDSLPLKKNKTSSFLVPRAGTIFDEMQLSVKWKVFAQKFWKLVHALSELSARSWKDSGHWMYSSKTVGK
jgi:hypothetical protein